MTRLDEAGDGAVISRKDLAESLGVSTKTITRYIAKGYLPPPINRLTGKHVFLVSSVRRYLRKQEKETLARMRSGKSHQTTSA